MKQHEADKIIQTMLPHLNNKQLMNLKTIVMSLVNRRDKESSLADNDELLDRYFASKRAEGCSEKSLKYYKKTITKDFAEIHKAVKEIVPNELRNYIMNAQKKQN